MTPLHRAKPWRTACLRPGDILLTSNEDIHKPEVRAGKPYERYVIWIHPDAIQAFHKLGDDLAACFLGASDRRFKLIRPDSGTSPCRTASGRM